MKRLLSLGLASFALIFFGNLTFAAPTMGNFTIIPTEQNAIKPSNVYVELKPGETVTGSVTVTNKSDEEMALNLYAADGTTTNTGDFTAKFSNQPQENIGLWITFAEEKVTLAPYEEKIINYQINVPTDTELKEYIGGITATQEGEKVSGKSIITSTRLVIKTWIIVTDNPKPIPLMKDINKPIPTPYFYASIVIFLGCIGYFLYARKKEKHGHSKK